MRFTFKTSLSLFILAATLTACGNAANEEKQPDATATMEPKEEKINKFAGIQFASDKDTICGMPLTAGVEDTLMVDGKVYGFCATECKNEFAKVLKEGKQ